MGDKSEGVYLLALCLYPQLEKLLCEDPTLEEKLVVLLKFVEGFLKGAGQLGNPLKLLGGQGVDVLIKRLSRINLVLYRL